MWAMTEVTQQTASILSSPADPSCIFTDVEPRSSSSLHLQTAAAGVSLPADRPHVLHIAAAAAAPCFTAMLTRSPRKCFIRLLEHRRSECVCVCDGVRTCGSSKIRILMVIVNLLITYCC